MQTLQEPGRELLQTAAETTGAGLGAAVGMLFGPGEAIAGAALGPPAVLMLKRVATEFAGRLSGQRERIRAGGAILFAAERLNVLTAEGASLRQDGFLQDLPDGRNAGREIAEGVVLAARDAFEERKVRHIGYLLANVAVDEHMDAGVAALALREAQTLSWRQYGLLAAVGRAERLSLPHREMGEASATWVAWGAMQELQSLHTEGYLRAPPRHTPITGARVVNLDIGEQGLTNKGQLLHYLLHLDAIPDADLLPLHAALATPDVAGGPTDTPPP